MIQNAPFKIVVEQSLAVLVDSACISNTLTFAKKRFWKTRKKILIAKQRHRPALLTADFVLVMQSYLLETDLLRCWQDILPNGFHGSGKEQGSAQSSCFHLWSAPWWRIKGWNTQSIEKYFFMVDTEIRLHHVMDIGCMLCVKFAY